VKQKSILVTGGFGFLGSSLVCRLIKKGHRVRVLDNFSRGHRERLSDVEEACEVVKADIRNAEAVGNAVRGVDCVCHLAFVNGTEFFYTQPDLVLDVGVKGMVNVIDSCIKHGVGELILASSSEVYQTPPNVPTDESAPHSIPDPLNPRFSYAAGKIISEIMALNYGRKYFERVVVFRPHNVYGPDMGWEHVIPQFVIRMKQLSQCSDDPVPFPIHGTGNETRSFVFIEDFIDGVLLVAERGENLSIYNIGTMEEISIKALAGLIGEYFGREIKILPGEPAKGGTLRRCPDMKKLVALGYEPRYSLRDGLPVVAKWYDENAHKAPQASCKEK